MQITKATKANPIIKHGEKLIAKKATMEVLHYIAVRESRLFATNNYAGIYQAKCVDIKEDAYLKPKTGRIARNVYGVYPHQRLQEIIDESCSQRDTEIILKKKDWEDWLQVHKDFAGYYRYENTQSDLHMVELVQTGAQFHLSVKVVYQMSNKEGTLEGKWLLPVGKVTRKHRKDVGTICYNAKYMNAILTTLAEYQPETIHITYDPGEPLKALGLSAYDKNKELLARGVVLPIH
jgi:hypothetical protein